MATTLGVHNPLRYRGYVYDHESSLYYLQSRYYDPEIGRFLNADALVTTGQGLLGNNMFACCNNNPVNYSDGRGFWPQRSTVIIQEGFTRDNAGALGITTGSPVKGVATSAGGGAAGSVVAGVVHCFLDNIKKKPKNIPSWKKMNLDIDHITSGHMPDAPRNPDGKKSVFYGVTASQLTRLIREAYNHSTKIATIGDRIKLRGYSGTFNIVVDIWINVADFVIESAYPKR